MCSFPSFFFHHIRFNLLKVDFCLNTFGNQILCKARSQAVLYTSRFFILFSSPFFTVRDAVSCMASRPQAVFVFTSRSETHTSRCCNHVSLHCEMLQCTGYTTRTSAVFSASRASDLNAFELQRANMWRFEMKVISSHQLMKTSHSRHQKTLVTKTEALL